MLELILVGIGTGNPDHLTFQGAAALNAVDLILRQQQPKLANVRCQLLCSNHPDVIGLPVIDCHVFQSSLSGDRRESRDHWH